MPGLDVALLRAARGMSKEDFECVVLQFVRADVRIERDSYTKMKVLFHDFYDLNGTLILTVRNELALVSPPSRLIAEAVLERLKCVVCSTQLIEGEDDLCTLCEAGQVADLTQIVQDLQN